MARVGSGRHRAEDDTARAIERALDDLLNDYGRYCLGEDADPQAYVERIRGLLEGLAAGTNHDPVAAAALAAFLDRVAIEEDSADV